MPGVVQHADGDYILVTGLSNPALPNPLPSPKKKNGRKEPSVKRMMGNTKMRGIDRSIWVLKLVENVKPHESGLRRTGGSLGPKPVVITDNYGTQISQGTISTGSWTIAR